MRFAYLEDKRIHIDDYKEEMKDKITCAYGHPVIAKRGEIKSHHFAHKNNCSCSANNNKGEWHIKFQDRAIKDVQEYRIIKNNKIHIADICTDKYIIEFQHSNISIKEIKNRESFYTNIGYSLVWVFDTSLWEYQIKKKDDKYIEAKISGSKYPMEASYKNNIIKIFDFGKQEMLIVIDQKGKIIKGNLISLSDFDKLFLDKYSNKNNDNRIFVHHF